MYSVGLTKEGTIAPIFQSVMRDMGRWLEHNGDAIYTSWPWKVQEDSKGNIWYTSKHKTIFAIFLDWPKDNVLKLGSVHSIFEKNQTTVYLLGKKKKYLPVRYRKVYFVENTYMFCF